MLGGSDGKESTCNVGDVDLIPGGEDSPGEGNGYSLQYSCLNSLDRGVWQATVHGVAKSQTGLSPTLSLANRMLIVFYLIYILCFLFTVMQTSVFYVHVCLLQLLF